MRSLVLFCAVVASTFATLGYDTIDGQTVASFQCMKSHGYVFYIARAYRSSGVVDSAGIASIGHAWSGGMTDVDAYIFPCASAGCPSPQAQVDATVNALKGVKFGMIWLDIEVYKWPANHASNQNFILALGKALDGHGIKWGVYSNLNNWSNIVGSTWDALKDKQLWWARYNGRADLGDFQAFGGWTKPNIHQYSGDASGPCGFKIDQNYY
ncbi:hypothetical protein WR25_03195 isoform A [Diploscapter pachys]|uniref:Uncharacterized protein n=2 Tax=Diploscapter pachys TaxID=2018661 RepID=A0A2A2KYX9_9BILA|nr:hypothetical protein WR25_03195 isoform A [Diploscapter pachys]